MNRQQNQWRSRVEQGQQREPCDRYVYGDDEDAGLLDVVVDLATLADRGDDGGKRVIEQNEIRCFSRYLGASLPHRNTDIRCFQRRRIVDAIAGHCHDVASCLQCFNQTQLLFGAYSSKNIMLLDCFGQFAILEGIHIGAGQHGWMIECDDAGLARDGERRLGIVTGDHDHAYPGVATVRNRLGNLGT